MKNKKNPKQTKKEPLSFSDLFPKAMKQAAK